MRIPRFLDSSDRVTYRDLIRQRVFQIACGYEDANDSNTLRCDPALKAAWERLVDLQARRYERHSTSA